ncbi:DUF6088 family protein [Roseivirga sp. UBA838]|uniref:DUF6088 family protein n=1 Tax=Roseivirga sp. UBA838 TaxID=1947393 RepID=UPI00257D84C6|nr:DUF6088 family protein [Roseivirga sp. UBA838]|tara:strand:- start:2831 stop:3553 length:723 start_codon:yes stop_codon:yes gene_type:complete
MSLAAQIEQKIDRFEAGESFTYNDLDISNDQYLNTAKILERLQRKGLIKKLSKGIFYKPEQTVFGEIKPREAEVIKGYLFNNGKRMAYITGNYLYNQMGLTRQIPRNWKIASFNRRIYVNRQNLKAKPVKAYAEVTEENYKLLGFLDALKDWKTIPDLNIEEGIKVLTAFIQKLTKSEVLQLTQLALKYPPRVRAFLGALLEQAGKGETGIIRESLNPITKFQLGLSPKQLPGLSKWNIE